MNVALSATPAALAVEIDPSIALHNLPPEPLNRESAEILANVIADDLRRILGDEVMQAGMVVPAALYGITELIRPGLPMVELMLDLYRGSLRGGLFEPQLLALGSAAGRFALPALAPQRAPGTGPLLLIPFSLIAPGPNIDAIRQSIESDLLEKGKPALLTDRTIRQLFGIEPLNLTYASFNDLSAMLKVQLDYVGFGALWSLLETSLYRPDEITIQKTEQRNLFIAHAGQVFSPFLTLDQWADSVESYEQWLKMQRQTLAMLKAHGVEFIECTAPDGIFAGNAEVALSVAQAHAMANDQSFFEERSATDTTAGPIDQPNASHILLTEQWSDELGPIAYTITLQSENGEVLAQLNDYPLRPDGAQDILQTWEKYAAAHDAELNVMKPKRILTAGNPPKLTGR